MKCEKCEKPRYCRGLCPAHYQVLVRKWKKQGFIDPKSDDIDYGDFWLFVKKELNIA